MDVTELADVAYEQFLDSLDADLAAVLRALPYKGESVAYRAATIQQFRLMRDLKASLDRKPYL